jgi:uncharacterized membrane protein YecN with MAPEG domain
MSVYVLCSAILVILYFLLSFNVSRNRVKLRVGIGADDMRTGPLSKSIRAQGNAAEYIPLLVVLFLYFNAVGGNLWITAVVIGVTVCRILHPIGIFLSADLNGPQVFRFLGAVGTYIGGIALGIALLARAGSA